MDPKRWVETALQATADGMIFVDRVGRVSFLNPAAERLTGWTSTAAAGRSLAEVLQPVHVESGAPLPLPLAQAMAEGDALPLPAGAALHSGAGEPMAIDGAVLPVVDERGRVDGAVILMHDVSERRNTRERLLSADRLASIGVLAAGVGHEINNPLTTVVANLEAATHELHEPQHDVNRIDHALIEARDGAEKVARIVKQLRGWAREASSTDDRPKVLELQPVVEGAVAMSAAVIRARARLVKDYGAAPPVLAGEARLGQLLTILLLNTARSLPEGRPHENEIRVAIGHDERGAAVIEVNDSGKSVRDELGLATVRSLVAALGGRVEVVTGAVRLVLPAAHPDGSGVLILGKRPIGRAARRVLTVDDEPLICGAVKRALAPDYQVTTFTSARAALASIAAGDAYDALLVDLLMPEMSGMDLYAEIGRVAPERAGRVVFLTGGAFTRRAGDFLKRVGNPRLEKPFDTRSLKAVLEDVVG